jgi:hypothetical protein
VRSFAVRAESVVGGGNTVDLSRSLSGVEANNWLGSPPLASTPLSQRSLWNQIVKAAVFGEALFSLKACFGIRAQTIGENNITANACCAPAVLRLSFATHAEVPHIIPMT